MRSLIGALEQLSGFTALRDGVAEGHTLRAAGLSGSARGVLAASLFARLRRTVLVVTASTRRAEAWFDDLHAMVRGEADDLAPPLHLYPSLPSLLFADVALDRQLVGQRLDTLEALLRGDPTVVVAPLSAVLHRTIPPRALAGSDLAIEVGQTLDPVELLRRLEELGYVRHDPVIMPGQCIQRGGIVDVYPMTSPQPLRVEFWGDEIESIRYFDVNSQRSTLPQQRYTVTVTRESAWNRGLGADSIASISQAAEAQAAQLERGGRTLEARRLRGRVSAVLEKLEKEEPFDGSEHYLPFLYPEVATIFDYLAPGTIVMVDDPDALHLRSRELTAEVEDVYRSKLAAGALLALPAPLYLRHDPAKPLWRHLAAVYLTPDAEPRAEVPDARIVEFATQPVPDYGGDLDAAVNAVQAWQRNQHRILCTTHQVGRLRQILGTRGLHNVELADPEVLPEPGELRIADQRLSNGFLLPELRIAVLTDHEVFGWHRARTRAARTVARRGSTALASLTELNAGDTVVHVNYGIGVYRGLITRTVAGTERDYLQIDYVGSDRLFVPVTELDRIQKFIGPEGVDPELNSLSDSRWRRTTARARKKAEAVARDLLELYAKRSKAKGHAFGPDTKAQQDMEAAFIYEETPDQLKAIEAVKKDMETEDPMDRLVCGDVGFGKTEVAVRAAFKAVQDGFQVAVLVPTTVLAQQHYGTFAERLAPYGARVEVISRFRTRKEQLEVLERVKVGEVDVLIGTHRLLGEDVKFPKLGLLIIDEEQRFGVRHKDAIKKFKVGVDVMTMSATPIPRTLNAALIGVRDLSLVQDPPQGRLPVMTTVMERADDRIREAVLRELDRDGQIYFLHNRVRTIERAAHRLQRLVPQAKIAIGHGQMAEDELEEVMVEMNSGRYDVLVCTSIIESGLDIPNVNTIVIDDCDQFGLAQLYQLIGRVGRRERQAYAYLVHRANKELTPDAKRRIEAIQELSELGSGFQIALRDLEIRGAGNILGEQQSGFIEEVGFELYTQMLSDALRTLMGEAPEEPLTLLSEVELPVQANLPPGYVRDEQQRLDIYRRLAGSRSADDVLDLESEVRDRFGRPPEGVTNLFRLVRIRMRCDEAGVASVKVAGGRHLSLDFAEGQQLDSKEMRIFARGLSREAKRGGTPRLQLNRTGVTADLREPRPWNPVDATETVLRMIVSARQEIGAERATA